MAATSSIHEQVESGTAAASGTNLLILDVDELDRAAVARYESLRALADAIKQAARRADARARLDAALALRTSRRPTPSIRSLDSH